MHEYAICAGLVDAVLEELDALDPPGGRLRRVRVVAGALHQFVPEFMETAFGLLTRDTPAAGARLELAIRPVTARCPACGWSGEIAVPFFQCPACGSLRLDLLTGKELYLDQLTIEQPETERSPSG